MSNLSALMLLSGAIFLPSVMAQTAVPVQVKPLRAVVVDLEQTAPADVRPVNQATLASEVTATISRVHVLPGQAITAGDLLLELDATDYELALQQALATLGSSHAQKKQADARLSRARELGANQYLSADDLLARETDVLVIEAQIRVQEVAVEIARRNLAKCRITAPFVGAVDERLADQGDFVSPGTPLLSLVQTDQFELHAEVPDERMASLAEAAKLRFVSQGDSWPARLLRISPVINTERRSRTVRLGFSGDAPDVGRSGELRWSQSNGLLPTSLLVRRNGQLGIFVANNGQAVFTPLPNAQEGRPVSIDLPPDTPVVVLGRERLQDGDRISVSP